MQRKPLIALGAVVALAGGGVATVAAVASGEDERQATGPGADRARAAAIRLVPGGTVGVVERTDEDGVAWEVELRQSDGTRVEVELDEHYDGVSVAVDAPDADGDG